MKKRILSLILTVAMMLSVMTILPISVSAEEATFSTTQLTIYNVADFLEFERLVDNGTNFSGKTVKLGADIDLAGVAFDGIGAASSKPFSGSFDGQGYAIKNMTQSVTNPDGHRGLFCMIRVPDNGHVEIKNLTLNGNIDITITSSGYCVGTVVSCLDAGTNGSATGNFTMKNVRSSVTVNVSGTSGTMTGLGGLIGFLRHATDVTDLIVNIDSCVYDGTMNISRIGYHVGGIVGTVGKNVSNRNVTINMTNTVFAGKIDLGWYSNHIAALVCLTRNTDGTNEGAGTIVANIKDCISTGTFTFHSGSSYLNYEYGIVSPAVRDEYLKVNVENLYYRSFQIPDADGQNSRPIDIVQTGKTDSNYTCDANSGAKTLAEIAALTANAFSAEAKFSFNTAKNTDLDTYYPCPTGLVKNGEWVDSLKVSVDAKVLGAQIRITDPADDYSGIRFVAKFRETLTTGADTADANFGLILVSKTAYNTWSALEGEAKTFAALVEAGVQVPAVKATTEDGVVTVKATVYNIQAANYRDEIVAIPYVNGAIVGEAVARSIFGVASECVNDANATAAQKTFAQEIIDNAPVVQE